MEETHADPEKIREDLEKILGNRDEEDLQWKIQWRYGEVQGRYKETWRRHTEIRRRYKKIRRRYEKIQRRCWEIRARDAGKLMEYTARSGEIQEDLRCKGQWKYDEVQGRYKETWREHMEIRRRYEKIQRRSWKIRARYEKMWKRYREIR
ncbi:hypothetical protein GEV33_015274 [Tenebrio molitor]|uniref:Uncharacterized protein n=1 Tax=Tenebrio molitor TaxID=7067 RepID=A0A8J6L5Y9_TENMO|nr:hypothetical protein GEV33_015274 [Tenebrio molitor]